VQISWDKILYSLIEVSGFIIPYIQIAWSIVVNWWWIVLPFLLWKHASFHWLWWRNEIWLSKQKKVFLEIRIPKESIKPIRAMEAVFTGLWQIWSEPNWIEVWWDGQSSGSYSFDIISVDGEPHFIIRCGKHDRGLVETHIYSQFPEAEIFEVDDYTKKVPQDIPNKEWDLWGTDYKLLKPNCYPFKCYHDFETEREAKEEKRIDPMSSLLEGMERLKKGEQLWVQIRAKPIQGEIPWVSEGKAIINKLVSRKSPAPSRSILQMIADVIIGDGVKEEKKEDTLIPPEMKLTPGERDVITAIDKKIGKLGYEVGIRYLYLARKDSIYKPNLRLPMSYFTNFGANNLNSPVPNGKSIPKIRKKWYDPFWFPKRRLYLKKRRIFRKYIMRVPYFFPLSGGTFVLNTEELATIYHFPSRTLTPTSSIPRVEAKKAEAPYGLPVED